MIVDDIAAKSCEAESFHRLVGELRLKRGVERINVADGRVRSLLLDSGEELTAGYVVSSVGYVETMKLLSDYDHSAFKHPVGKLSFAPQDLVTNIQSLIRHIEGLRPATAKGVFIQKVVLSSSMGPGIKLNVA